MLRQTDINTLKLDTCNLLTRARTLRQRFNNAITQASPLPPARVKLVKNEITIDKSLEAAVRNLEQVERLLGQLEVKDES